MSLNQVAVGPQNNNSDSSNPITARAGRQGDQIVSELHGRFYEQAFRQNMFCGGAAAFTINNATYTTSTLGATCTPIIGLWNPIGSGVNASLSQAMLHAFLTAATATGPGGWVWAASTGNNAAPSTGAKGTNRFLGGPVSKCQSMINAALTGLTTNLVVQVGSALSGGQEYALSEVGTAVGFMVPGVGSCENFDGSWIVPPGGIIALLATTTPVAHTANAGLMWEEVPN